MDWASCRHIASKQRKDSPVPERVKMGISYTIVIFPFFQIWASSGTIRMLVWARKSAHLYFRCSHDLLLLFLRQYVLDIILHFGYFVPVLHNNFCQQKKNISHLSQTSENALFTFE